MCDHIHNVEKTQLGLMNIEVAVRRKDRARDVDDGSFIRHKHFRYILTPLWSGLIDLPQHGILEYWTNQPLAIFYSRNYY
jgi:hypothetical protein